MSMKREAGQDGLVEIRLFADGSRYRDDVFVCVNGESCLIRRGEPVRVRPMFAEVLAASQAQDRKADELMRRAAERAQG